MRRLLSDDEFLRLWDKHRSPHKMAVAEGLNERVINVMRRRVERNLKITLVADSAKGEYAKRITRQTRAQVASLALDSGVVFVFSDAHYWPGEPSTAHLALLRMCKELRPAAVIANGDMFDGAGMHRHPRIGWDQTPTVKEELDACQMRMGEIEKAAQGARRCWTLGNHDLRFDTRLAAQVAAVEGVRGFTLREHFPNWEFAMRVDLNADCVIKHRFRGGIHASYNNTLHAGKSLITGHLHSQRITPLTDYNGTRYGVDAGCLADPIGDQFLYTEQSPTNWRSGFAVLTVSAGRLMPPELVEVIGEGRAWFRGRVMEV